MTGLGVIRRGEGRLGRPVVVLLHGAMDRAASFGRVARRLDRQGLAVVAPDRRGYGTSTGLVPAAGLGEHVDDLCGLLDGLDGPKVVVGHSIGGTLALAAGAAGRTDIAAVGAFECPLPWLDGSAGSVGRGVLDAGDPGEVAARFYRSMVGETVWQRLGETDRAARRAEGPALVAELTDLRRGRALFDVDALEMPVHLAVGAESPAAYRSGVESLASLLGAAVGPVRLAGAAHGAHLSHPDAYAAWVAGTVVGQPA